MSRPEPEAPLEKILNAVRDKRWEDAKSECRKLFECEDRELDVLGSALTEVGFLKLCAVLDEIRRAPAHQTATLALGVPLVLAGDMLPVDANNRALTAANTIIQGFGTKGSAEQVEPELPSTD